MLAQHLLHVRLVMHVKATLFSQVEFVSPLKETLIKLEASFGLFRVDYSYDGRTWVRPNAVFRIEILLI